MINKSQDFPLVEFLCQVWIDQPESVIPSFTFPLQFWHNCKVRATIHCLLRTRLRKLVVINLNYSNYLNFLYSKRVGRTKESSVWRNTSFGYLDEVNNLSLAQLVFLTILGWSMWLQPNTGHKKNVCDCKYIKSFIFA